MICLKKSLQNTYVQHNDITVLWMAESSMEKACSDHWLFGSHLKICWVGIWHVTGKTANGHCMLFHGGPHPFIRLWCHCVEHMCFGDFFVNKSLFASTKWIFNILVIFLCEHQLEVRDLLLQQFLHQTNWSFYKSLSQMLECSYLNKMWPKILGLRMGHNRKSILRPNLRPRSWRAPRGGGGGGGGGGGRGIVECLKDVEDPKSQTCLLPHRISQECDHVTWLFEKSYYPSILRYS